MPKGTSQAEVTSNGKSVTRSTITGHNRTSLNLQYKALGAYLHTVEKI